FLWALSTGRGRNDVRIVDLTGPQGADKVVQTIPFPGLSGGVAMSPDGRTAYVSGLKDSTHQGEQVDPGTPGRDGDVIHVLRYDPKTGLAARVGLIPVPPPGSAPPVQSFPPGSTEHRSWPRDIAVSPDGRTLLVALNLADAAAIVDTATGDVRYVDVSRGAPGCPTTAPPCAHYPYGAGITNDGRYGLVGSETGGSVSVIDLTAGSVIKTIQVAAPLSHPQGIAMDPKAPLAFVANANQDTITVIDTDSMSVARTLSVERPQGIGTSPTYVSVTPDGCDLLSADSGEDAVAIFALSREKGCGPAGEPAQRKAEPFELVGRIPTGSYPTVAAATPNRGQLVWGSARGLGVGPNPNGPNPSTGDDTYLDQYLPSIVNGSAGVLSYPSDSKIRKLTPVADMQVVPENAQNPPPDTPIRAGGPIKHVF